MPLLLGLKKSNKKDPALLNNYHLKRLKDVPYCTYSEAEGYRYAVMDSPYHIYEYMYIVQYIYKSESRHGENESCILKKKVFNVHE